jgi:hypothetical protein
MTWAARGLLGGSPGRVLVPLRRRKTVNLAEAKNAFKKIIKGRHDRLGTSATADLQRIDAALNAFAAWSEAKAILATLTPADAPGCCTYTIDSQTFKITMTSTECDQVPVPRSFDPSPCP